MWMLVHILAGLCNDTSTLIYVSLGVIKFVSFHRQLNFSISEWSILLQSFAKKEKPRVKKQSMSM